MAEEEKKEKGFLWELNRKLLRIKLADKIFFTENMRVMIKAGLSLTEALRTLAMQTNSKGFREVILEIHDLVEKGQALSEALKRYPKLFEPIFTSMVAAGEASGTMESTLEQLTEQMRKDYELRSKIKGAMTYPAVVLGATMLIATGMMLFVIPQILSIFDEFGADELPLPTKILVAFSDFFTNHFFLLLFIVLAVVAGFLWFIKTKVGKYAWHKFLLSIFIIGPIVKKVNMARFTRTLSSLLRTDIPIVQGMEITANVVRNVYYRDAILEAAEALKKGEQISQVMSNYPKLFAPLVVQMSSVGERSGSLDNMLVEIAEFYEKQVDNVMNNLASIIEPLLIIFLGFAVGGIALAIITPIYSLTTKFGT